MLKTFIFETDYSLSEKAVKAREKSKGKRASKYRRELRKAGFLFKESYGPLEAFLTLLPLPPKGNRTTVVKKRVLKQRELLLEDLKRFGYFFEGIE